MIGFMLKLENPHSVTHAAENAFQMDENLWRQLISSCGALDVLPAGKIDVGVRIEPAHIRSLLDFARRHYQVSLPGPVGQPGEVLRRDHA